MIAKSKTKKTSKPRTQRKSAKNNAGDWKGLVSEEFPHIQVNSGAQMDEDMRSEAIVAVARACESLAKSLIPPKPYVSIIGCTFHNHSNEQAAIDIR